ncbi:hypothetical protein ACEYXF_07170 [Streptomyces asiaticus]|uniref:hypothetical protein n=1 Tax=Streptomyces asiaticus TaxID=114695 RepID=UPI0039BE4176
MLPAAGAVSVWDDISDEAAASLMVQGITAHHFVTEAADIQPGQVALVHAAAGGLGQKLTQLIKAHGGTAIGIVSSEQKAETAPGIGADHTAVSPGDAFVDPVGPVSGRTAVRRLRGRTTEARGMQGQPRETGCLQTTAVPRGGPREVIAWTRRRRGA